MLPDTCSCCAAVEQRVSAHWIAVGGLDRTKTFAEDTTGGARLAAPVASGGGRRIDGEVSRWDARRSAPWLPVWEPWRGSVGWALQDEEIDDGPHRVAGPVVEEQRVGAGFATEAHADEHQPFKI